MVPRGCTLFSLMDCYETCAEMFPERMIIITLALWILLDAAVIATTPILHAEMSP